MRETSGNHSSQGAEIIAHYRSGEPSTGIAAVYSLSKNSVIKVLREAGVAVRRQSLADEQIDEAVRLYIEGQSLARIGAHLDVDHGTVWRALKKQGVKMRDTHGR
ncbi:helix-turn-helix domain-containing protein, partial [Mycobacteroides abscessus subsp. massiliense]